MKKLSYKYIKNQIEKEHYVLVSKEYINSRSKIYVICQSGHKFETTWSRWNAGNRCGICYGGVKTIEYVREFFKREGYILLSKKYKGAIEKLDYICPNGHRHNIRWSTFRDGQRCPICSRKRATKKQRIDIDDVRKSFINEGYVLLSKEYKNNLRKLDYICPNGHRHSISWCSWLRGSRCGKCYDIKKLGSGNPNWKGGISCDPYCDVWLDKDFKEAIKERDGYQCLNPVCNKLYATDLTIHHIDYNKKNCSPSNLITLCRSCNGKANHNREWHKSWYKILIQKRGLI